MIKRCVAMLCMGVVLALAGCTGVNRAANGSSTTPVPSYGYIQPTITPAPPTPTPTPLSVKGTEALLTNNCLLLDSHDIASLFSSAEVMQPLLQVHQVNHVIFSTENISATEASCLDYAFHLPGSMNGEMLQVTYWTDVPNGTPASTWAKVWTDAKSQAAQAVPGIGDDAFYNHGRLTFKDGPIYVTLEVKGTKLNTDTSVGVTQQITIEKQLALDAFNRATSF
jgi:hypothetical protein